MKSLRILLLLLLPLFAVGQTNIDTIALGNGITLVVDKDVAEGSGLEFIGEEIDEGVDQVKEIIKDVDKVPNNLRDWLFLIFSFAPILTSLVTRATRVVNGLKELFANIDTLPIVFIIGTAVAGVVEYLQHGINDFSFASWGGIAAITITGAVAFYEATKGLFGKTPKAVKPAV